MTHANPGLLLQRPQGADLQEMRGYSEMNAAVRLRTVSDEPSAFAEVAFGAGGVEVVDVIPATRAFGMEVINVQGDTLGVPSSAVTASKAVAVQDVESDGAPRNRKCWNGNAGGDCFHTLLAFAVGVLSAGIGAIRLVHRALKREAAPIAVVLIHGGLR